MEADYGGTEMRSALQACFAGRNLERPAKAWDLDAVLGEVRTTVEKAPESAPLRVSVLGIGDAVSTAMWEGIARVGHGVCILVGEQEMSFTGKIACLLKASRTPLISNISVDWGRPPAEVVTAPESEDDFEMVEEAAWVRRSRRRKVDAPILEDMVRILDNLDAIEAAVPGLKGRLDHLRDGAPWYKPEPRIKAGIVLAGIGKGGADISDAGKTRIPFYVLPAARHVLYLHRDGAVFRAHARVPPPPPASAAPPSSVFPPVMGARRGRPADGAAQLLVARPTGFSGVDPAALAALSEGNFDEDSWYAAAEEVRREMEAEAESDSDPLEWLARLQSFDGHFSSKVFTFLKITETDLHAIRFLFSPGVADVDVLAATVLAMVAGRVGGGGMYEKAKEYVEDALAGLGGKKWVDWLKADVTKILV
ncbi:hypothetical protein DFH08DRAFT_987256 [Mycena albidolilacea]|uniref:Uncharacterized protein n=1 Tax=Mycena albidolilacea TaxID=1033008 RepID=A0AAD7EWJ1_9AGAR|nr:hypothetical protein DFH08DRAFT_987256 [Mycena albidolilacea]